MALALALIASIPTLSRVGCIHLTWLRLPLLSIEELFSYHSFLMAVAYSWYTSDKKPLLSLYCYRIICLTRNIINRRTYALIDLLFIIPVLGCIRHAIRFLSTSCVLLKLYCSFLFPSWREYPWYHFDCNDTCIFFDSVHSTHVWFKQHMKRNTAHH